MIEKIKNILSATLTKLIRFWNWFKRASWKKRIAVIIVLFIALAILKNVFFGGQKQQYTFDTVSLGTITQLVTENGNVISSNETDVFSPTTGSLDQIYVKNGDHVQKGDKLFTVSSTATAQEQAVAYASYLAAKSTFDADTANSYALQSTMYTDWKKYTDLATNSTYQNADGSPNSSNRVLTDFTTVQDNWFAAEAAYKNQQSVMAKDQAALTSASLAYQATQNATITAPTNGTVTNIIGLTGAKVIAQLNSATTSTTNTSSSTTSQTATPVLIISSTHGYAIHTAVSEVDINKIALGQPVSILFSAVANKTYYGKVTQEDTYGTNASGVITYNVFITMDNGDTNIKPNMSANLTINTAEHKNVLTVANAAIVPYQNGKAVQLLGGNGKIVYKPVLIGLRGFTRSEVLSGITQGTKVILGNTTLNNNSGSIRGG